MIRKFGIFRVSQVKFGLDQLVLVLILGKINKGVNQEIIGLFQKFLGEMFLRKLKIIFFFVVDIKESYDIIYLQIVCCICFFFI